MFIVHRIVFPINIIFVLLLLGSYLAPWVNPENYWMVAFLGLMHPFLLLINFLFVVYWAIFLKLKVLYSFTAILCGFTHFNSTLKITSSTKENGNLLKVMSYNCNFFGYGLKRTTDTSPFFDLVKKEQPGIICFQEFMWEDNKRKNYINKCRQAMDCKNDYFYLGYKAMDTIRREYGQYIISKYTIINRGVIEFGTNKLNRCIWADVLYNNDTLRIYNAHLESIKLGDEEYKIMKDGEKNAGQIERTKSIVSKMKGAYMNRAIQARLVSDHIQSCPYKTVLCGDFNDTPVSYAYSTITKNMKDAFVESGSGFSRTYAGVMPSFRIDYIMADKKSNIYNYTLGEPYFSDHHLIEASVTWDKK
ncbi:MAG: endonuclease/exonuclease/phosphatase family protein [Bacteroidota bacterium]|nr:endonuclease/exonuclease/phosphatase family protein [Bacteroidota bacterium]